ncbi:MAG: hypothetical protein NZM40_08920 [Sphingomonadaceae bacterium]|uniref:hypothetical protein n=1 Tax=Thermaurantiacus sp. TaxID=2820283 RepID=UPI00298F1BD5|nr:hypothetical protein [Thermaurantiacus sp.]MCS6987529.1 hypothetical protein [Sphingomonadaceae bacterium]MDW8415130.1 hypothetical protein [Thermaurantiacus sp.]
MGGEAEAGTVAGALPVRRRVRPRPPDAAETILWEGRPSVAAGRSRDAALLLILLAGLMALALFLVAPHFQGSAFAGRPGPEAVPLVLVMAAGTLLVMGLPLWFRATARGRARYVLTNRRALVLVGRSVVAEALLFGAEMTVTDSAVSFWTPALYLDWRLRDEGPDRLRFDCLADPETPAAIAEAHGARRLAG